MPITARLVADMVATAAPTASSPSTCMPAQLLGFFSIPTDELCRPGICF